MVGNSLLCERVALSEDHKVEAFQA
jgi:hypothetical protein